jgi:iron complex outermembrane receptor protein
MAALLLVIPATGFAADNEKPSISTLDEVVVTATKIEERRKDIPNAVVLYDQYDIEELPVTGIGDLLANDLGLDWRTQGDYGGAAQVIHIRGMSAEATQVFINGVSIVSPSLGQANLSGISLNNINKIEVVKGSGSLLYGTGAMGGTISIFTKRPTQDIVDLRVDGGVGTNQTYHLGAENGLYINDNMGYYLTANYITTDGFRSNSDLDQKDVSLNLVYNKGEILDLSLYGQYLDRDFGRPGVKPPPGTESFFLDGVEVYNSESASLLDRGSDKNGMLVLTGNSRINDRVHITLFGDVVSQKNYNLLRYVDSFAFPMTLTGQDSWTNNLVYELEGDVDIIATAKSTLLLGAEYKKHYWENESITLDSSGSQIPESGDVIEEDLRTTGVYGEYHYRFMSNLKGLAGLRYENNSEFGSETLPRFGLVTEPWPNTVFKASSGKHFNAPTPNDLFWPFDGFSRGNPDLKPETGWHSDITWEQSLSQDRVFFTFTYFHWTVDDKIQWLSDSDGIYTPMNLLSFVGDGLEAGANFKIMQNLMLGLDYTFIDAEEEAQEFTVMDWGWAAGGIPSNFEFDWVKRRASYTPRHLFKGKLVYFTDWGLTVSAVARYTSDRITYRTETDGMYPNTKTVEYTLDSYWTFDMQAEQLIGDHLYITLLGTNLTDEEYDTFLDSFTDYNTFTTTLEGFPGAGRSVFLKLAYKY